MLFTETPLAGAYVIEAEKREDDRGYFARVYCENEFTRHGLDTSLKQANVAFNRQRGITRGMHYQRAPHQEVKIVRCTQGSVFDAIVDLRSGSDTLHQWFGLELSAANAKQLYVPKGFAHGYQVLEANSELHYLVTEFYSPDSEAGLRWDDPSIGIEWPLREQLLLSDKDSQWALL